MLKILQKRGSLNLLLLATLLSAGNIGADPVSFDFSQGGFEDGAFITGSFSGEDLNGNGELSSFDGEITDFSVRFSGNSRVTTFTFGLADLGGLVFYLDGGFLLGDGNTTGVDFDGEGILVGDIFDGFFYTAGVGPNPGWCQSSSCGKVGVDGRGAFSKELVIVSPKVMVPEPATLGLFSIGLFGLVLALRHRSALSGS